MALVGAWLKTNLAVYRDNATARRDFRSQLRGNRAIILWSVYLLCLIGIAVWMYSDMVSRRSMSIVEAQSSLQGFYQAVMMLLAGMVTLVGPAMAATTVVIERERRSLDLIFSAPVRPKTLLVGKMISAYRYMWMLLILSLPVAAVCVVLGGATWSEVLAAYALLSLHALLFSSMALMVSSMAPKPVSSIVWTYFLVGAYSFVVGTFGAALAFGSGRGGSTGEAPFVVAMSPFTSVLASGTYTSIGSWHVPNWILFGVYVLFMSRFFLLGAASVLSPYNSIETKNLKITGLVAVVLISGLVAYTQFKSVPWMAMGTGAASNMLRTAIAGVCYLPLGLLIPLPLITCFNLDSERRYRPNGVFAVKEMLRGTPAGGLPYALSLVTLMSLTMWIFFLNANPAGMNLWPKLFSPLIWSFGFWTLMWSFGRFTSALSLDLKTARSLHLAIIIAILALPIMLLPIMDPDQTRGLWFGYLLYPPVYDGVNASAYQVGAGIVMLGLAFLICLRSEQILKAKIEARRKPPVVVEGIHA